MTNGERTARLKTLAGKAGESIFERLRLVCELIADNAYIAAEHEDESKALDAFEAAYFGDLCGARSLAELLEVYRAFPTQDKWRECQWNVTRVLAEFERQRQRQPRQPQERQRVKREDFEAVKQEVAEKSFQLRETAKQRDTIQEENAELRRRVVELERENLQLHAKLEELEKLMTGARAMATR